MCTGDASCSSNAIGDASSTTNARGDDRCISNDGLNTEAAGSATDGEAMDTLPLCPACGECLDNGGVCHGMCWRCEYKWLSTQWIYESSDAWLAASPFCQDSGDWHVVRGHWSKTRRKSAKVKANTKAKTKAETTAKAKTKAKSGGEGPRKRRRQRLDAWSRQGRGRAENSLGVVVGGRQPSQRRNIFQRLLSCKRRRLP